MKPAYQSILVLTATITAVSLYAYFGPDPTEKKGEEPLEAVVATASVHKSSVIDQSTGLPVIKMGDNELVFTSDIREEVASKLMEQLVTAGFFSNSSSHKMILGREPNSYIIFFTLKKSEVESIYPDALKKLLPQLSRTVFNHQPVVIKVINEEKEVMQVLM